MTRYISRALHDLQRWSKLHRASDDNFNAYLEYLKNGLEMSVKFQMPLDGKLVTDLKDLDEELLDCIRLPYPVIAAEYDISEGAVRQNVTLAIDLSSMPKIDCELLNRSFGNNLLLEHGGALVTSIMYSDQDGRWVPAVSSMVLPYKQSAYKALLGVQSKVAIVGSITQPFGYSHDGPPPEPFKDWNSYGDAALREYRVDINAIANLALCSQCTNVEAITIRPDRTINRRRKQSGKPPLYEYKILTIRGHEHEAEHTGSHSGRASPRQHLRRGHIRRLASGKMIWVRYAVIGSSQRGVVDKEYKVKRT